MCYGAIDNEILIHAIAHVWVLMNLTEVSIDQEILALLPQDVAERFMAVPLAEVRGRLAVAMIDANNVQAVDFLSESNSATVASLYGVGRKH